MLATVLAVTADVAMVNGGETLLPAGTVTEGGTTALGSLLPRVMNAPPAGAGPLRVTVFEVLETPPTTVAGDNVNSDAAGGSTVSVAVFVTPL